MATGIGTAIFVGLSGQAYVKDLFFVDTANALLRWDAGAGSSATSPDFWETPEPVTLMDLILVAATAQTRTRVIINGNPTQSLLRNSLHIPSATIITRPYIGIKIPAGAKVGLIAIA